MDRTTQYTVFILRTAKGYQAVVPAFPDIQSEGQGARIAYARVKTAIKARVLHILANNQRLPRDPLVQARTLRLDIGYLKSQEELR